MSDTQYKTDCTDGVTPTPAPTTAPTFDKSTILAYANNLRSKAAAGEYAGNHTFLDTFQATAIESWLWNDELSVSAFCQASECSIIESDPTSLAVKYQQLTDLIVSSNANEIIIGETKFIDTEWSAPIEVSIIVKHIFVV